MAALNRSAWSALIKGWPTTHIHR